MINDTKGWVRTISCQYLGRTIEYDEIISQKQLCPTFNLINCTLIIQNLFTCITIAHPINLYTTEATSTHSGCLTTTRCTTNKQVVIFFMFFCVYESLNKNSQSRGLVSMISKSQIQVKLHLIVTATLSVLPLGCMKI